MDCVSVSVRYRDCTCCISLDLYPVEYRCKLFKIETINREKKFLSHRAGVMGGKISLSGTGAILGTPFPAKVA